MLENVVEEYGWESNNKTTAHGYIIPEVVSILKNLGSKKVLDLGCGNGALCSVLNQKGFDVAGVEHDVEGFKIASFSNPDINFYNLGVQNPATDVVEQEGLFDTVVSTEVIEHLFSPHFLPKFASQVLAKDGYLIVTTPYHGYLKNLVLSLTNKWDHHFTALWHGGHIKFWSKNTITQLLNENGFSVVSFSGIGRFPYMWKSMVIVAKLDNK